VNPNWTGFKENVRRRIGLMCEIIRFYVRYLYIDEENLEARVVEEKGEIS
jgi:hypothetical protein